MDMNEVICDCFQVTVGDLKDAIDNGAKSFEEVQEVTSAGTACGSCIDQMQSIVEELLK